MHTPGHPARIYLIVPTEGAQDNPRDGQVGHRQPRVTTVLSYPRHVSQPFEPASRTPAPLTAAAGLVLVEGLLLLIFGITEAATIDSDRLTMGVTVSVFFVGYGGLLLVCSWGLYHVRVWARGPVLLAQLVQLGLAWNFKSGGTLLVAIALALAAVLVLAGLLHPHSIEALERDADRE
jgi:hypothetical protein